MRVIGGSSRGRRLRAPAAGPTRPTSDRVREAVFDILGSLTELEGASVVDLFAGSGALGIEALSRGAASAVFVDDHREALSCIRANLAATGLGPAEVVRAEVVAWLRRLPPTRRFDLALADPPYAFDAWPALLEQLPARLAVLESSAAVACPPPWKVLKEKRYGGTLVTVIESSPPEGGGARSVAGARASGLGTDQQKGSP